MNMKTEITQQAQLSPEAYQLAMHYPMGGLIAEHKKRQLTQKEKRARRFAWPALIFLYPCLIGLLAFTLAMFILNLDSFLQFFSASFVDFLISVGFTLFMLSGYTLLFLGIPYHFYRNRNPRILHCTEGLIYHRGKRTTTMRWDEIESVSQTFWIATGNAQGQSYTCTLRLCGKKYAFGGDIENAHALGRIIEREITRRRIATYWHRIKEGEKLQFGPLSINKEGLSRGSKLVPWSQISQVHIFQGVIAIAKDGIPQKWPLVRTARIPNFFLFVALIHPLSDNRVSYQPLNFEFTDYALKLIQLLFAKKREKESRNYAEKALEETI